MRKKNLFYFGWLLIGLFCLSVSLSALAVTDGVNVNLHVNDSTPQGGGGDDPDPDPIYGCTDPGATNYNSNANTDDGSCNYPPEEVPNVSSFSANYNTTAERVILTWTNPIYSNLAAVRVIRKTGGLPVSPSDGSIIYEGLAEEATDASIAAGITYYYAAFVRSENGNYSSGSIDSVTIPEEEEEPEAGDEGNEIDDDDGPEGGAGSDGGGGGDRDPFVDLPTVQSVDPLINNLETGDFRFSQPAEPARFFAPGATLRLKAGKPITITIDSSKLPEVLKTIGVVLSDPTDSANTHSFILKSGPDGSYGATLPGNLPARTYEVNIYVINFQDQTVKRLTGTAILAGAGLINLPETIGKVAIQAAEPLAITLGLASGVIQGLALTSKITSLYDVYLLLIQLFSLLARYLGLKKRYRPWGVVYDAITKRPLDPAYVVVRKEDADVNTAITDLDGRYGFLLPAGQYYLVANKTHYQFPSKKLAGRRADELYENLYFGGEIKTTGGEVVNQNIPLDPVAFDWNEFAKNQQGFFVLNSKKELWRQRIYQVIFYLGFGVTFYKSLTAPSTFNLLLLGLYLLAFFLRYFWRYKHPVTTVKNAETGLPLPFAIIRAFVPGVDQQVKSVVSDEMGRFYLLTPPGVYYLTVEEKLPDGGYRKIHQTPVLNLKRGVVTSDLIAEPSHFGPPDPQLVH